MKNKTKDVPSFQKANACMYTSLIRDCVVYDQLTHFVIDIDETDVTSLYDISNLAPTTIDDTESSAITHLSVFLEEQGFLSKEVSLISILKMNVLRVTPFCVAFLVKHTESNGPLMSIYLEENIHSPIVLVCQNKSILKYFVLRPKYEDEWTKSVTEKQIFSDKQIVEREVSNSSPKVEAPTLNYRKDSSVQQLKKKFDMIKENSVNVPSLFSLLGCVGNSNYSIYCKPHPAATLVIVLKIQSHPNYPEGVFIKLTHLGIQDPEIMKYLQGVTQNVKVECNHIAQVYDVKEVYLKDIDSDLFFACRELVKGHFGKQVCEQLQFDDFESHYSNTFFSFDSPIEIDYLEILQPINIKEIISNIKKLNVQASILKVLIISRWIGQCLIILQQLHEKLNILHCDISFDNILTRRSTCRDTLGQLILKLCNRNQLAVELIPDLVISDLNTAGKLVQPQNNSSDEQRKTINPPDANKFPYTWHTYEFYGSIQSDNYAMAIFIAKLVKRLLFEDFTDFLDFKTASVANFKEYGKSVINYFENKLRENVDKAHGILLPGLIDFLKYILFQSKTNPSLVSECFKIYQSKIVFVLMYLDSINH